MKSKLPIEITVRWTNVITHLYATPDPRFTVGLQLRAPMSARAVAVIRPAPTIIALTAFLFILSGQSSCTLPRSNQPGLNRR